MSEVQSHVEQFIVSEQDKELIEGLLMKVHEALQHNERVTVISYQDLPKFFSKQEIHIIDRVSAIDPTIYGFKGPKLAIEPVPNKLVRVESQPYIYQGGRYYTDVQFIPEVPYQAFRQMAEAMERQIGRKLVIESSYRSNAFQAITFLEILKINSFDIQTTAKRVAVPGYSEHGSPSQLALDVKNVDGLPSDETPQDFEGTEEYEWLVANAGAFNFFMSYPKDNLDGIMFEPWHWRYKPSGNVWS
jgi:hypothetical protein